MCHCSGHREVHEVDFPHQAPQFLLDYPELHGQDGEKLEEFHMFSLCKANRARLRVNQPPQNLFYAGPVALACHQFLDADRILGFARQGRKNPF